MELAPRLEEYLRRLDNATSVEVRENGRRVTTVEKLSWELRGAAAKPLLSIRSERYNVTHSVVGIRADSDDLLALAVERFGNPRPGRLEFRRVDFTRPGRDLARQDFCPRLVRILSERFPDESVENLKVGPDLEH